MLETVTASGAGDLTKSESSRQKLAEDLDQFMNLLVTQLKHQDPLDPMDPNEFTSQLVEFASVEQQIQANANLEQMVDLQQTSLLGTVVSYIGKSVEVTGNKMPMVDGKATASYSLDARADTTTITVTDRTGRSVLTTPGETGAGRHSFEWNGKDMLGFPLQDGTYTITVSSLDESGNPINVSHTVTGMVTGVSNDNGQAILSLGDAEFDVEDVLAVKNNDN